MAHQKIEAHLAKLIIMYRRYQQSVRFIIGTDYMATVISYSIVTYRRNVKLKSAPNSPPLCCAYSTDGNGFPCYHRVALVCEKHGAVNLHKFISERNLAVAWNRQYSGVSFDVPHHGDVDLVRLEQGV